VGGVRKKVCQRLNICLSYPFGILFLFIVQVECELFPALRNQRQVLRSVNVDEALVQDYLHQAVDIYKANFVGPQKYLTLYRKYADLLNGKAEQEITAFLSEPHSIESFKQVLVILVHLKTNFI
jgi:hypothetical protein